MKVADDGSRIIIRLRLNAEGSMVVLRSISAGHCWPKALDIPAAKGRHEASVCTVSHFPSMCIWM